MESGYQLHLGAGQAFMLTVGRVRVLRHLSGNVQFQSLFEAYCHIVWSMSFKVGDQVQFQLHFGGWSSVDVDSGCGTCSMALIG